MHKSFFILLFGLLACSTNKHVKSEHVVENYNVNDQGIQYAGVFPSNINRGEIIDDFSNNRKVIYRDTKGVQEAARLNGTVAIKCLVNRPGDIVYTEIIKEETTVQSHNQLNKFLLAALNYKVQADKNAYEYQFFVLTFTSITN